MDKSRVRLRALAAGFFGSLILMAAGPAFAWDGMVQGTIQAVDVTQGSNYGFRVYIHGTTSVCSSGANWAYVNETDSNYKTFVSALMMAKAQGSTVTIYTTVENGYCHIGYITVS